MPGHVSRDLTAAGRMSDQDDVTQIECLDQFSEIIRVRRQIIALPRLRRPAASSPIMRNRAVAGVCDELELRIPSVRRQRPAMAEDDRLTASPVLVKDLSAICGSDETHQSLPLSEPWSSISR